MRTSLIYLEMGLIAFAIEIIGGLMGSGVLLFNGFIVAFGFFVASMLQSGIENTRILNRKGK